MRIKITISLIWSIVAVFAFFCGRLARDYPAERHIKAQQEALDRVPTFKELQKKVGAVEDGIIGPNTIALWEKAICNQYAIEAIERMAKGKE